MTLQRISTYVDQLPPPPAGAREPLSDLESAIFAAVAYRDVFQFAPTAAEVHRYLPRYRATPEAVAAALSAGPLIRGYLITDGEHFALPGREAFFATRIRRRALGARLRERARQHTRFLANLPFVEMIGLTGSLAADNPDEDADIDVMIVVREDRLWRVNAITSILKYFDEKIGTRHFCPNVMRSTRALAFESQRLYTAQELAMMEPLYGYPVYLDMLDQNPWLQRWLPNASPRPAPAPERAAAAHAIPARGQLWTSDATPVDSSGPASTPAAPDATGGLRTWAEKVLDTPVGTALESRWYARRMRQHHNPDHLFSRYTPFTTQAQGLYLEMGDAIEDAMHRRLAAYAVACPA